MACMPSYSFRCAKGCHFDRSFTMAEVPAETDCPDCGEQARRIITSPHIAATRTAAFRAIDDSARSAHEPSVVTGLPSNRRGSAPRVTRNPLHQKLPRT